MDESAVFVGIDVAKAHLDVARRPAGDPWRVANDEAGIAQLVRELEQQHPTLVVLEATGGLEVPVAAALAAARTAGRGDQSAASTRLCAGGRPVGQDGCAGCPAAGALRRSRPPNAAALAGCPGSTPFGPARSALPARRYAGRGTTAPADHPRGHPAPRVERHITWLRDEREAVDRELQQLLRASPVWRERAKRLRSVPGSGRSWPPR